MFDASVTIDGHHQRVRAVTVLGAESLYRRTRAERADVIADPRDLLSDAHDFPYVGVPAALLDRVVREAGASDVLGGSTGFTGPVPSPLSPADPSAFDAFRALQGQLDALAPDGARIVVGDVLAPAGARDISLKIDGKSYGALVFASDAIVVALPPGTTAVSVRYEAEDFFQLVEESEAKTRVTQLVGTTARTMLVWRAYQGTNTLVTDGVSDLARRGRHRVALGVTGGGILVGRIVFWAHRRIPGERGDPTYKRRRRAAERADQDTVAACPDLEAASKTERVVVAVHGTMASAVPLAAELRGLTGRIPVVRFEHDTWRPIDENAKDLVSGIAGLDARDVLLVAHSRGGLVARHAIALLKQIEPELPVRLVTLGTPFKGSPLIGPAGTALLGVRALLGMVRLASGELAVDLTTRVAGLLIRGRLPRGLAAMEPGSDYLAAAALQLLSETTTVAGDIDPHGPIDANAIGFLRGISADAFAGVPNDLVVAADSARGDCLDTVTVASDHFSYMLDSEVQARICRMLPDHPSPGLKRDLPVPRHINIRPKRDHD
jgi:hypothetical protein